MSRSAYLIVCCVVWLSLSIVVPIRSGVATIPQNSSNQVGDSRIESGLVRAQVDNRQLSSSSGSAPHTTLSNRLLLTGTMIGMLLGQLSVLLGYLKIDHATRGFYSGRLQSVAAVAAVAVLVAGYLFYISWMS